MLVRWKELLLIATENCSTRSWRVLCNDCDSLTSTRLFYLRAIRMHLIACTINMMTFRSDYFIVLVHMSHILDLNPFVSIQETPPSMWFSTIRNEIYLRQWVRRHSNISSITGCPFSTNNAIIASLVPCFHLYKSADVLIYHTHLDRLATVPFLPKYGHNEFAILTFT